MMWWYSCVSMLSSPHIADISLLLLCFWMDTGFGILKANCLHNSCFQKYRGVGRHADQSFGSAPQHGPEPAIPAARSLHWTTRAGRGVRRAARQHLFCHLSLPPASLWLHSLLGSAVYWTPPNPLFTSWQLSLGMVYPLEWLSLLLFSRSSLLSTLSDLIPPHHRLSLLPQRFLRLLCGDILVSKHLV